MRALFFVLLAAMAAPAQAQEYISPPGLIIEDWSTGYIPIRYCPGESAVTGVRLDRDELLCTVGLKVTQGPTVVRGTISNNTPSQGGSAGASLSRPPQRTVGAFRRGLDVGISATNQLTFTHNGVTEQMHVCPQDQFVMGINVPQNAFLCGEYVGADGNVVPLGAVTIDGPPNQTVRDQMHACPEGSVLIGAHFDRNVFACAEVSFCGWHKSQFVSGISTSHCPAGLTCRLLGEGTRNDPYDARCLP